MRMISMKRVFVYLSSVGFILLVSDLTGLHRHLFEKDYNTEFTYPLEVPDFPLLVQKYRQNQPVSHDPINQVASNLNFIHKDTKDCGNSDGTHRLIILVKSAPRNADTRFAIRATWGNPKRFSDVQLKTVFLLGTDKGIDNNLIHEGQDQADISSLNDAIEEEVKKYGDIIQADFHDSEDNSTVKTTMGLRWLVETCPNFRFALIVNEGMYVSVKNMLKFIRHPSEYPMYWEKQKELDEQRLLKASLQRSRRAVRTEDSKYWLLNNLASDKDNQQNNKKNKVSQNEKTMESKKPIKVWKNSPIDFDIDMAEDVKLYAGHVRSGATHRHKLGTKYFLPIEEYPFDYMPPYVSSEAIVMSKPAVLDLYYASFFTKYLRLDDVFLGICAKKINMYPFHSEHFQIDPHLVHDPYGKDNTYVLTADNFVEPERLQKFWNIQKSKGNA